MTEFVGLTAERISATAGISADSLADDNATQVGGEIGVSLCEPDSKCCDIYVVQQSAPSVKKLRLSMRRAVVQWCCCVPVHVQMRGLLARKQTLIA